MNRTELVARFVVDIADGAAVTRRFRAQNSYGREMSTILKMKPDIEAIDTGLNEKMGDFATHDLLTGRLAFHEQAIWMLRATIAD